MLDPGEGAERGAGFVDHGQSQQLVVVKLLRVLGHRIGRHIDEQQQAADAFGSGAVRYSQRSAAAALTPAGRLHGELADAKRLG